MRRRRTLTFLFATALAGAEGFAQESPYLYGIHDHDTGQQVFLDRLNANGVTGWVTATIAIGTNPNDGGGGDFRSISSQGHGVIVRLNNGYCGEGTIPAPARYDDFAVRAGKYAAATQGANIFVIGNETNLPAEWPIVNGRKNYVSPTDYATLFRKTYDRIKAARPDAKVVVQALAPFAGPYSAGSVCGYAHDANPINWVQYTRQMLDAIRATGGIDGIALHINSRGYLYNDIHSTQKVSAAGQSLYFSFYVYKDWIDLGIPSSLYHLPLYATESNGIYYWSEGHPERPDSRYERGWVQEVYAEINRYNQQAVSSGKPIFRAVTLYRWCSHCDGWNIDGSPYESQILDDVSAAAQAKYRWPTSGTTPPPPLPSGENLSRRTVSWAASSSFNTSFGGNLAYDGIVSGVSKWTSNGSSAVSWLALDLGDTYDLTGFVVRHAGAGGEPATYNTEAFRLETGSSLSGPFVTESTISNAARANTSTVTLPQSKLARYVRLYITDAGIDNYARIPEFEVYGHPLSAPPPPPPPPTDAPPGTNAARSSVAWQASSTFNAASSGNKAYDGVISEGSKWTSNGQSASSWLAFDLGAKNVVTGFIVRHAGAGGEPAYFNTQAFRLERAGSFAGPWTSLVTVDNASQKPLSIVHLDAPVETRFVRLFVTDAGIDNYARIPELEVYSTGTVSIIPNLVSNGNFSSGLSGWTIWTERGTPSVTVDAGQLVQQSGDYNGEVYQQLSTGGVGRKVDVAAFWAAGPTAASRQWAEILVINGTRSAGEREGCEISSSRPGARGKPSRCRPSLPRAPPRQTGSGVRSSRLTARESR